MKITSISHFLILLLTSTVTVKILFMTIPLKKRDDEMSVSGHEHFWYKVKNKVAILINF